MRVRVRLVFGSCPVCVWFVSGFVFGLVSEFASGLRPGSCPVRVRVRDWASVRVCVWFATGFVSGSGLGSCQVRVQFVSGSCLVRFVSDSGLG